MLDHPNIYFLGAGGIGMSALLRYFLAQGKNVGGYDKTSTPLTDKLSNEGAALNFNDEEQAIPASFKDPESTLVILTPAIPKDSLQWAFFKGGNFQILKRAQVLGLITQNNPSIAVAGTHGKTTISSMVAHCFKEAQRPFTAFLGGISKNLGSNYYHEEGSEYTVIEADEYDRSFLQLYPEIAGVSAVDPDHLDIYGTPEEMVKTLKQFLDENLSKCGIGIIEKKLTPQLGSQWLTYSITDQSASYFASHIKVEALKFSAKFNWDYYDIDVEIGLPGIHNLENALLCFALCEQAGLAPEVIAKALKTYRGVDRRFDVHIDDPKCLYIDDYAHHPEEIRNLVLSVKKMFPERRVTGIFQPHLFSRTQDFLAGFAEALDLLDVAILLDIYPARELPIPGVNSQLILDHMKKNSKMLCSKKDLLHYLDSKPIDVVLTIGAGDIGLEVPKIKETLLNRLNRQG